VVMMMMVMMMQMKLTNKVHYWPKTTIHNPSC